jgi:predicted DNA-binding protein
MSKPRLIALKMDPEMHESMNRMVVRMHTTVSGFVRMAIERQLAEIRDGKFQMSEKAGGRGRR